MDSAEKVSTNDFVADQDRSVLSKLEGKFEAVKKFSSDKIVFTAQKVSLLAGETPSFPISTSSRLATFTETPSWD